MFVPYYNLGASIAQKPFLIKRGYRRPAEKPFVVGFSEWYTISMSKEIKQEKERARILGNTMWLLKVCFNFAPLLTVSSLVAQVYDASLNLLRAFVIGLVIDWIIQYVGSPQDSSLMVESLAIFSMYYILLGLGGAITHYSRNMIGFRLGYQLPIKLLHEKLDRLGSATLENPRVQNLINIYENNNELFRYGTRDIYILISAIVTFVIALIPLSRHIPIIAGLAIVVSLPAVLMNRSAMHKLWRLNLDTTVMSRRAGSIVSMLFSPASLKEIRLLDAYAYIRGIFEDYASILLKGKRKIYKKWVVFELADSLLTGSVIVLGIYMLIQLAVEGTVSIGQLTFLIAALVSLSGSIDNFSSNFSAYIDQNQKISELRKLLEWPEEDESNKKLLAKLTKAPLIDIRNVSFKYPNSRKYVIKDLNLQIRPNEEIAIVGENGAGKTTLVKLISGIYPVTKGEILIDGENINSIQSSSWYRNLGVLFQDFNKYEDLTAAQNIAIGRIDEEVDNDAIIESAKKADAYKFIMEFENEFSQVLSERYEDGTRPSTGQWQKIAIARFFYRNAPVLILDEPTAAIDAVAEANIFDRIYEFIENKTVIIISHRFSTVRNADRIIVFDQGKIVEEGSHEKLMELGGKYAQAFKLQSKGYN